MLQLLAEHGIAQDTYVHVLPSTRSGVRPASWRILGSFDHAVAVSFSLSNTVSDPASAGVRTTFDVDAISEITSYADYLSFSERLRNLGFTEDMSEDATVSMAT